VDTRPTSRTDEVRFSIAIESFNLIETLSLEAPWHLWNITGITVRDKDNRVIDHITAGGITITGISFRHTLYSRHNLSAITRWWRKLWDSPLDRVAEIHANFANGEVSVTNYALPPDCTLYLYVTSTSRRSRHLNGA